MAVGGQGMRCVFTLMCAMLVAGCAWSEDRFVNEFVEADCAFLVECYDDAVLEFLGWDSVDDCIQDRGTEVVTDAEGCEYNKRAARACVKGIEEMACPADGSEPDYPLLCDEVFRECEEEDSGA